MEDDRIVRCRRRIAEEERLAREAPDDLTAELHVQKARLYRTQLAVFENDWTKSMAPPASQRPPAPR